MHSKLDYSRQNRKTIIIVSDFRTLPLEAAISLYVQNKNHNAELWIPEESLSNNDFGQSDSELQKRLKILIIRCIAKTTIIKSNHDQKIDDTTGIESSLTSITHNSRATKSEHPELWESLASLNRNAQTISEKLSASDCNNVFIFNGRLASTYEISKTCKKHNINAYFYEYSSIRSRFGQKYKLLSYPPHNMKRWGASILETYHRSVSDFLSMQKLGQSYKDEKFSNKFTHAYSESTSKKYNATIFLSSPHEYSALNNELCDIDNIDPLELVRSVNEETSSNAQIAVRCHPNQAKDPSWKEEFDDLINYCNKNKIDFYPPDSDISSYSLIDKSEDTVVDLSSIGIDAFLMGKNVKIYGSPFFKDIVEYLLKNSQQKGLNPLELGYALRLHEGSISYLPKFKARFFGHILRAFQKLKTYA